MEAPRKYTRQELRDLKCAFNIGDYHECASSPEGLWWCVRGDGFYGPFRTRKEAKRHWTPPAPPHVSREDRALDEVNEARWEYDLPPISREEKRRRDAEYMDEHYGYDIDK